MRQLRPDETARPGDWWYTFGYGGWDRISNKPAPVLRMTIKELEEGNKRPHFPIVICRPGWLEGILGTPPNWKPNQRKIRKARGTHAKP